VPATEVAPGGRPAERPPARTPPAQAGDRPQALQARLQSPAILLCQLKRFEQNRLQRVDAPGRAGVGRNGQQHQRHAADKHLGKVLIEARQRHRRGQDNATGKQGEAIFYPPNLLSISLDFPLPVE